MKYIVSILALAFVLATVPAFVAGAEQASGRGDVIQPANDNGRSQSDRSTSHDRHVRKHRTTSRHHRQRATVKGNH
jgi:Ni/Co efflux regulator RcnB